MRENQVLNKSIYKKLRVVNPQKDEKKNNNQKLE